MQVLGLLVSYVAQPREHLAGLGISLLQRMICRAAPTLAPGDWQTVLESLSRACSPELGSPLFRSLPCRNVLFTQSIWYDLARSVATQHASLSLLIHQDARGVQ